MNSGQIQQKNQLATVSTAYLATVLVVGEEWGVNVESLCRKIGLPPALLNDRNGRLNESFLIQILEQCVTLTGRKDFGLLVGQKVQPGSFSALGYAAMSCETLNDAIALVPRFENVVLEMGLTTITYGEQSTTIHWQSRTHEPCPSVLTDAIIAGWLSFGRWISGKLDAPVETHFRRSAPEYLAPYEQFFNSPLIFNSEFDGFVLSNQWLSQKLLQADKTMHTLMDRHARELQDKIHAGEFSQRVVTLLQSLLPQGQFKITMISKALGVSERTLRRRLQAEGNSFQKLLTDLRQHLAREYLKDKNLSILDITLLLGYSEHSTFSSAFKSWNNITPGDYRLQVDQ